MLKTFTKYLIADKCIDLFFSGINLNFNKLNILPIYGLTSWAEVMNIISRDPTLLARYRHDGRGRCGWWSYDIWKDSMDTNSKGWEETKRLAKYWDIDSRLYRVQGSTDD